MTSLFVFIFFLLSFIFPYLLSISYESITVSSGDTEDVEMTKICCLKEAP